ncbi:ParA family protein [Roseomonas sp. ACRSG]|nr:ParA family protein [Roseomonas sp. ACRSG]
MSKPRKPTAPNKRAAKNAVERNRGAGPAPRWISIQSPKGGVGKTTLALNLAELAARDGLHVALLDTDLQRSLTKWHLRRPEEARHLLLLTRPLAEVEEAIQELQQKEGLDLVIVDTPPAVEYVPDQTKILMEHSDLVLVPSTTGSADVESVIEWMGLLRRRNVRAAFVINRANTRVTTRHADGDETAVGTLSYRDAQRHLNAAGLLCPVPVRQFEDINNSHGYGVGVVEVRGAKGADDFESVWHFVRNMAEVR